MRDNILAKLKTGEDSTVEFKTEDVHADSLASEIVAFANAYGGSILIGVDDEGQVVGVSRRDMDEWIINVCRHNCVPGIIPLIHKELIDDKLIYVIEIGKGVEPYRTNKGVYYIRVGSTKQIASTAELQRLFQSRGQVQYDQSPVFGSTADDINLKRFAHYYRRVYGAELDLRPDNVQLTLRKNGVLVQYDNELFPTIGGMLIFGTDPQQFLHMSGIAAVYYQGTVPDSRYRLTGQELGGTLTELIDEAVDFVKVNMRVPSTKGDAQRIDEPQYPLIAVREGIVNAVAHRDYSLTGARTRLFMFDDRLEIHSPGKLPNTQTIEDLGLRPPFARNQLIVGFLQRLGYIEYLGEGILTMRREMRRHNGTEPHFEEAGDELVVTLWGTQKPR